MDLHDTRRAALLYELLEAFRDRLAVHDLLRVYTGSIAHFLGMLAGTLLDWPRALDHLEHALEIHRRIGARPFVVRTQYESARVLIARGGRHDATRARALLREAADTAAALGMQRAHTLARDLAERCRTPAVAMPRASRK
jgi:hypothetical protein